MRTMIICLLLLLPLSGLAEMYRWVDEKGQVQFSDKPPTGDTEAYEPPPVNTTPALPSLPASVIKKKDPKQAFKYESLKIISPENDQTFLPDSSSATIRVEIKPRLNIPVEDMIVFTINGNEVKKSPYTSYTMKPLTRGSHTVNVTVVNKKGETLLSAEPITFHVMRPHL